MRFSNQTNGRQPSASKGQTASEPAKSGYSNKVSHKEDKHMEEPYQKSWFKKGQASQKQERSSLFSKHDQASKLNQLLEDEPQAPLPDPQNKNF